MNYVPVDPDSRVVHVHAHPEHDSDTRTLCGADGSWVKSFAFLDDSYYYCAVCWCRPQADAAAPTLNEEES